MYPQTILLQSSQNEMRSPPYPHTQVDEFYFQEILLVLQLILEHLLLVV